MHVTISSRTNPRIKRVVKLRRRSHRDAAGRMIVEGYREILRAVSNRHLPSELFFCRDLFQGENEDALLRQCRDGGAELLECTTPAFHKISYRDRPDGLLAVAPAIHWTLDDVRLPEKNALVLVMEAIEKPGNLGTILRSCDAAGVDAVLICDRCTDLNNPNVVRASIGTLFALPVIETATADALAWLRQNGIRTLAATPHASRMYHAADMRSGIAVVVGPEQYGLSDEWLEAADDQVRIPMQGQADSLNVASAATILLYESVRQRGAGRHG